MGLIFRQNWPYSTARILRPTLRWLNGKAGLAQTPASKLPFIKVVAKRGGEIDAKGLQDIVCEPSHRNAKHVTERAKLPMLGFDVRRLMHSSAMTTK